MEIGDEAPSFSLPDTDGDEHGPYGVTVVAFTCNHCPYALGWHDALIQVARDYDQVTFLAVNPNDAERYPADSYEAMKERVRADGGWPHPYLRDETQEVARAYGAKTTPDLFLLDAEGRLRYRARRGARRSGAPAGRDRAGRLQRQVEAVIAATAAAVSLKSSR